MGIAKYLLRSLLVVLFVGLVGVGACTTNQLPSEGAVDGGVDAGGETEGVVDEVPKRAQLRVMSFNVQCSFCLTQENDPWLERLPHLQALIKRHDPDLLGAQELFITQEEKNEVALLVAGHPVYTAVYYKAKEGESLDFPDATIYFRTARFELREQGFFWLSPTPDVYFSKGFANGGQFPRIVAWARLFDKQAQRELVFATTHFDNNTPSQEKSAPLSLQRLGALAQKIPLIFVGDFNSKPDSVAYKTLTEGEGGSGFKLRDSFVLVPQHEVVSNQTPIPPYNPDERIDHIFLAGDTFAASAWIVDHYQHGEKNRFPSDHRAIMATISY